MELRVGVLLCVTCCGVWAVLATLQSSGGVSRRSPTAALERPGNLPGTPGGDVMAPLTSLAVASLNVRYAATVALGTKPGHERPWADRRDALGT